MEHVIQTEIKKANQKKKKTNKQTPKTQYNKIAIIQYISFSIHDFKIRTKQK